MEYYTILQLFYNVLEKPILISNRPFGPHIYNEMKGFLLRHITTYHNGYITTREMHFPNYYIFPAIAGKM